MLVNLVEEYIPDLHAHFQHHSVEINLITLNWFLTLYTAALAPRITLRLEDITISDMRSLLLYR